jgi:hypothetical protein
MSSIRNIKDATLVSSTHLTSGSPTLPAPTFLKVMWKGWLSSVRGLAGAIVSRNPPQSIATAQGHMGLIRQHVRSTQPKPPPSSATLDPVARSQHAVSSTKVPLVDETSSKDFSPEPFSEEAQTFLVPRKDWAASGLAGRFPRESQSGMECLLGRAHSLSS